MLVQPDGLQRWFWRDRSTETALKGQGNWVAEIKGNRMSVWADCGWRLDFMKGKIVGITTPKNRKLEFAYNGAAVAAVRENGLNKLIVEWDDKGVAKALVFNDKRIEIDLGSKPRVQTIAGQNVIGSTDDSLGHLRGATALRSRKFVFSTNEKLQPTLEIQSTATNNRLITWDPISRRIVADGRWTYHVEQNNDAFGKAAIARTNRQKQRESWHDDRVRGEEVIELIDGRKTVSKRFVGGLLDGLIRSIEIFSKNGKLIREQKVAYDENGRQTRISSGARHVEIVYKTPVESISETNGDWSFRTGSDHSSQNEAFHFDSVSRQITLTEIKDENP